MKFFISVCLLAYLVVLPACAPGSKPVNAQEAPFDWRSDWAVEEGFSIEIDSEGYHFPTAIAFVPNPGQGPKDPLYFVTEVRGKVKVVTNDRTVYTFAEDFFELTPKEELPSGQGQVGLAGICLEPQSGYVFVTFAYQDERNVLRNNIIRFQSKPETFSLEATSKLEFTEVFLPYEAGLAHHIGPCQLKDGMLYVSVGEAWQPFKTQQIDTMHGKIIRMTLDSKPVPDNPFYQDDDIQKAANYVWASGLRNPFGLKIVEDRLFVADNGQNIDRFLEIRKGENYLWDGNDRIIATNADFVFVPSFGPVQMDYYPQGSSIFPVEYQQSFFVAGSAFKTGDPEKIPGIMALDYSLRESKILSVPKYFVKYRGAGGDAYQAVTGLAFGPDGLYFSPLVPNEEGKTFILKATYNPSQEFPFTTVRTEKPDELFVEKGCAGCHRVGDRWGYGGVAGPDLERDALAGRLQARLGSDAYIASLTEIDKLDSEPQVSFQLARKEVMEAKGMDRIRAWMKYRIQEPRFDNLYSQMPNLDVSEEEAIIIADFLLEEKEASGLRRLLPRRLSGRHLAIAFAGGFFAALLLWGLWRLVGVIGAARRRKAT